MEVKGNVNALMIVRGECLARAILREGGSGIVSSGSFHLSVVISFGANSDGLLIEEEGMVVGPRAYIIGGRLESGFGGSFHQFFLLLQIFLFFFIIKF